MSILFKVANFKKDLQNIGRAARFAGRHKKRVGSAVLGAGLGAAGGNTYNKYSGEENEGERRKNIGKGAVGGALAGAIAGPSVPKAVKGVVGANRRSSDWFKRNKKGETNLRELAKDTATGTGRKIRRGAKRVKEKGSEFLSDK